MNETSLTETFKNQPKHTKDLILCHLISSQHVPLERDAFFDEMNYLSCGFKSFSSRKFRKKCSHTRSCTFSAPLRQQKEMLRRKTLSLLTGFQKMIMFMRITIYISVFGIPSQSDEGLVVQLNWGATWSFLITRYQQDLTSYATMEVKRGSYYTRTNHR